MGRWKRVAGLPLRQRQPTDEERLIEIIEVFKELREEGGTKFVPEDIIQQFKNETGKLPNARLLKECLK